MQKIHLRSITINLLCMLVLLGAPMAHVYADATPELPSLAPLLITEVQAGSATSASEEFIELYNTTQATIDLDAHPWQLEIASSNAADWSSPLRSIPLNGQIAPGATYVVASQYVTNGQTVQYLPTTARAWFSAGISAAAGHIRLTYNTNQIQTDGTCSASIAVVDEVEWSAPKNGMAATPSIDGRNLLLTAKTTGLAAGSSLQRLSDPMSSSYIDTNNDAIDFSSSASSTPGDRNSLNAATGPAPNAWQPAVVPPADDCNPAVVPSSAGDNGGTSTLQPPVDSPPSTSQSSGTGTTSPTNEDSSAIPAADQDLLAPQLSEILPNPAPPQTDAADEFIELYNTNDRPFDLSGFKLSVGTTTLHTYIFPAGTSIAPKSFHAFFSADTGLSLSNTAGQVTLIDPLGKTIVKTDQYGLAKDGQAWVLAAGKWQWTMKPTPNAPNIVLVSEPAIHTAVQSSKKSTSSVKAASATKKAKSSTSTKTAKGASGQRLAADTSQSRSPLHPVVLAILGALAVLYGAYEYRYEVANRIRWFRSNRADRRKARQGAERRGGD